MLNINGSGCIDNVAAEAIKSADRPPGEVTKLVRLLKYIADWNGFEITGRIWLRDRKTGREYR